MSADVKANNRVATNYFDGLPMTGAQRRMAFLIGACIFFDVMVNVVFSFVAPFLAKSWDLSLEQIGEINFAFFVGMFFKWPDVTDHSILALHLDTHRSVAHNALATGARRAPLCSLATESSLAHSPIIPYSITSKLTSFS